MHTFHQSPDYPIPQSPDARTVASVGRSARLELSFGVRAGRTVLDHAYAEPPFRIGRAFDLHGAAYVIIVCSGPGVFAGDVLRQTVHVARGARVVLTSQAALQIHPSPVLPRRDCAIVQCQYAVEPDGELHCHWDPVIPFAHARVDQRFDIRIADGGRLYWSDALMAGRNSRGEAWQFESLAHELALRADGVLIYLERYRLRPRSRTVVVPWAADAARYVGTSLVYHPGASIDVAERWHQSTRHCHAAVDAAVDLVAPGLIVARVTSADGAPFARFRASYRASALEDIFGAPELAGRK